MSKALAAVFGGTTPQTEQAKDNQVENNAGGFVFQISDFKQLERFLILGSEGGTYYVTENKLSKDNAKCVERCAKADGTRTVNTIVSISEAGRAPKNDQALFALAMVASIGSPETRAYALENLPKVARIGTHLFQFAEYVNGMRGWGRGLRNAVAKWYTSMPADKLAYQIIKYQSRSVEGCGAWSHDDLLRLSHAKTNDLEHKEIFQYITEGWTNTVPGHTSVFQVMNASAMKKAEKGSRPDKEIGTYELDTPAALRVLEGFELAKRANTAKKLVSLISEYNLSREMLPTEYLKTPEVWEALLVKMPYTAMIRNLGNMSKAGILGPNSNGAIKVMDALKNRDLLRKAKVHPIAILAALMTYKTGHSLLGKGVWDVNNQIVNALDESFYLSFEFVKSTGKRFLIGQDISGSMTWGAIGGLQSLTPAMASAALAMVTVRTEPYLFYGGFGTHFEPLKINAKMRLDEVLTMISAKNFGGTDCSLPMVYAAQNKIPVDVFAVYTDGETYAGKVHPYQALKQYREKMGINAKSVVVGMTATKFSIADPSDPGMLDVAGFSTSTPAILADFVSDTVSNYGEVED